MCAPGGGLGSAWQMRGGRNLILFLETLHILQHVKWQLEPRSSALRTARAVSREGRVCVPTPESRPDCGHGTATVTPSASRATLTHRHHTGEVLISVSLCFESYYGSIYDVDDRRAYTSLRCMKTVKRNST